MSLETALMEAEQEEEDSLPSEILRMSTEEIISRSRLLDNEVKIMRSEVMRIQHELQVI